MTLLDEHRHRFDRAQFAALAAADIPEWRCELIAGELVDVSPMSSRHAEITRRIHRLFVVRLDETRFYVGGQDPVGIDDWSEPMPDVWVAKARPGGYMDRHPETPDMVLLVEVGWSSIRFDREIKLPIYAAAGIGEFWLVDVDHTRVEVYRRPVDGRYTDVAVLEGDDSLTLPDGSTALVADLLT